MSEQAHDDFEDPVYAGDRYPVWSLKPDQTPLILRVLPPCKEMLDLPKRPYAIYQRKHFVVGTAVDDPTKRKSWPVACAEVRDSEWNVTQECPLCAKRKQVQNEYNAIMADGAARGPAGKKEAAGKAKPYAQWLKDHGSDGKWYLRACNQAGEFGVLRLINDTYKDLREQARGLAGEGMTPMDKNGGVFWSFGRKKADEYSLRVIDTVAVATKDVIENGKKKSEQLDTHDLTPDRQKLALSILPNFVDEQARLAVPLDKMVELADCDDPVEVNVLIEAERKFSKKKQQKGEGGEWDGNDHDPEASNAPPADEAPATPSGSADETTEEQKEAEPAEDEDAEVAKMRAMLAQAESAAKAKKSAAAPAAAQVKSEPAPAKKKFDPTTISDADFAAKFAKKPKAA